MKSLVLAAVAASMVVAVPVVSRADPLCSTYDCPGGHGAHHAQGGQYNGQYRNGGQYRMQAGNQGYYRGRHYYRGYDGGYDGGYDAGAGVAALAAGALIGGVLASQAQQPMSEDAAYCARRYRSYDPASGTYLGYDGLRHPCYAPQ